MTRQRYREEQVTCDYCGAKPGQRCIVARPGRRWGRPASYPHAARFYAAKQAGLFNVKAAAL